MDEYFLEQEIDDAELIVEELESELDYELFYGKDSSRTAYLEDRLYAEQLHLDYLNNKLAKLETR